MAELRRLAGEGIAWGPAEQAALDRCLVLPRFPERPPARVRLNCLSRTIESEIIPRLLLAHRADDEAMADAVPTPTPSDVGTLAGMALACSIGPALAHIDSLRARNVPLDAILLDLLAPAARLIGDMWTEDLCTFADATLGLSTLQQILCVVSPAFETDSPAEIQGSLLLAPAPGEQHSFGVSILEEFFRRAGWNVCGGSACLPRELVEIAGDEWFDVIGLSLSCDTLFAGVRSVIDALRRASRNPHPLVMVGGRFFMDHPERAAEVGADIAVGSAPEALIRARSSLPLSLARC